MTVRYLRLAAWVVATAAFPGPSLEGQEGAALAFRMNLFEGASLGLAARHGDLDPGSWTLWSADLWLGPGYVVPRSRTTIRFYPRSWRSRYWTTWHPSGPGWAYVVTSPCWHCWSPWRWDYAPYTSWWWDPWWGWVTAQPVWGISVGWGWAYYHRPAFFDPWWGPTGFLVRWRPVWAYDPGWWYRYDPWWVTPGVSSTTLVIPGRRTLVAVLPSAGGSGVTYKERPWGAPAGVRTAVPRAPTSAPATGPAARPGSPDQASGGSLVPRRGGSSPLPGEGSGSAVSRPQVPQTPSPRVSPPPERPASGEAKAEPPLRPSDRLPSPRRDGEPSRATPSSPRPSAGGGSVASPPVAVPAPRRPSDRLQGTTPEAVAPPERPLASAGSRRSPTGSLPDPPGQVSERRFPADAAGTRRSVPLSPGASPRPSGGNSEPRTSLARPVDPTRGSPSSGAVPGRTAPTPSASRGAPPPAQGITPSASTPRASRGAGTGAVIPSPPAGARSSAPPAVSKGPASAPTPPPPAPRRGGG